MITAGDFRNGVSFEMDDSVYQIIEFQHVKPGKKGAALRHVGFGATISVPWWSVRSALPINSLLPC